jgi:hypothetical protein
MSDAAHWNYGGGATGQPKALDPSETPISAGPPCMYGQGYARIAGTPKRVLVVQPVAGAEWLYKHTGPSWILLRSITWKLVTSAAVATRASRLQLKFGTDLIGQFPPSATQAASLTVQYTASDCGLTGADATTVLVGLSNSIILGDNMSVGSSTNLIDVADQYSLVAIFGEEFKSFDWCNE